jgi:hypothetical protein
MLFKYNKRSISPVCRLGWITHTYLLKSAVDAPREVGIHISAPMSDQVNKQWRMQAVDRAAICVFGLLKD